MTRFPLRYAHQNILVGEGDARAALFRVDTVSYPFLAAADKREWLRRLARFAFAVEADFSLWRVCREYPAERYAEQAMALLDERQQSPAAWRSYLNGHEAHLRELRSFTPEVYLAVSLPGAALGRASIGCAGASRACSASRTRCRSRRRRSTPWSSPRSARSAAPRRRLPVRRATTRELQWLLRRAACRGVAEPALDDHWEPSALIVETADGQPAYEPLGTDLVRHANAPVLEQDRALVVDAEEGRSHQAMLGMGALPEESEFPGGAELLFTPLEALRVPGRRRGARALARQPRGDHARAPADRRRRRRLLRAAELDARAAVLRGRGEPAARARARRLPAVARAAAAAERRDLARRRRTLARRSSSARVEALVHRFGTVALHRPLGLQPALFLDHLPRADGGTVRDYADVLTIEQFGALMPVGTHQAGSERGVYIGRTLAGGARPVRFDVTEASRTGRPPSILLAGHARVGQDDRRRAARLPGRAPRLARRRRRPQARSQPRGPAGARRARARDRALRRRSLPRAARPARRRARGAARGPRQLVPDRAAPAGAARRGRRRSARPSAPRWSRRRRAACACSTCCWPPPTRTRAPPVRRCRCGPTPASPGSGSATASARGSRRSGR